MAKMFYTMDETKAALAKSEDEVKQLSKEGKLREFRDGPRLMFKADQVETLKSELSAGGDEIALGAGDTHTPLGLMDSKAGSSGGGAALKGDTATGTSVPAKDDTAGGMDVGLSGSLSGSIGGGSLAGSAGGGSLAGSLGGVGSGVGSGTTSGNRGTGKPGVNIFDEGGETVDPMAQTHITPPKDQISLEGVGSGSGLLDLTRETDDTSLGAALLDEISPGGKGSSGTAGLIPGPSSSGSTAGLTSISPMEFPQDTSMGIPSGSYAPVTVEVPDSVAPAFGLASLMTAIVVMVASFVMINAIINDAPLVGDRRIAFFTKENSHFIFLGIGAALAIIGFVIGIFAGKSRMQTA